MIWPKHSSERNTKRRSYAPWSSLLRVFIAALVATLASCARKESAARGAVSAAITQTSISCRECHPEAFAAWSGTDHALANRKIDPIRDEGAFSAHRTISDGGARYALAWADGNPRMVELRDGGTKAEHGPDLILGSKPLWQPLLPMAGGRWQPTDMAFDVKRAEWFNVFGAENRRHGEWGHWSGRGMNWNSMCAACHMTGYSKNYDEASDSYASRWVEHGVGCIQCHGPMSPDHKNLSKNASVSMAQSPPFFGDRAKIMETCAPCHARNEALTENFQPGDRYSDHYRLVLPANPALYYPDGQQRDEVFSWTSVLLSRMGGHAGVTCMDCHDPHTNQTRLPSDNNQLCMQCHAAPGRVQPNGVQAPPIDPLAHSHHKEGSTGSACVACHMPTTNYMQRAPRHDHGWRIPDPLMNKELGIPDACSRCHADQPVEWSIAAANEWYGTRMDTRQRTRARAIDALQHGRDGALDAALALWPSEDIPVWRATLLELFIEHVDDARVREIARNALRDAEPIVRAAAVRVIGRTSEAATALRPLLDDPMRVVRLDAAWVLSAELPENSPARAELDRYLKLGLDQPAGRLLRGQDYANRGQFDNAVAELNTAVAWDPNSPALRQSLGLVYLNLGQLELAANLLAEAADQLPNDGAAAHSAALALAEAGHAAKAERYLRLAVERDPDFHRAWYNLGLIVAEAGRAAEAIVALEHAEQLAPRILDYPYALATLHFQLGELDAARAAATRVLSIDPNHDAAQQLLRGK